MYTDEEITKHGFEPATNEAEAAILVTNHDEFKALGADWYSQLGIKVVVDGRGALDQSALNQAGIQVLSIFGG
jgi:UDP-N-acetyl-D-mannosaminuronate dehydrogenase